MRRHLPETPLSKSRLPCQQSKQSGTSGNSSHSSHGPAKARSRFTASQGNWAPTTPTLQSLFVQGTNEPVVFCYARRTGRITKNSRLQLLPWKPALRAHSGKPNPLPARPALIMSHFLPLQMSRSSTVAPNPSIEGMPKRLRLLCTPHVKR